MSALRASGHDLEVCEACHTAEAPLDEPGACGGCHEEAEGARACSTCHGVDWARLSGPHPAHLGYECSVCHQVPEAMEDEGHLEDRGAGDVRFSGLALARDARPTYDPALGCSDTACHAGVDAAWPQPIWALDRRTACGDCHAAPPADHPNDRCDRCHEGTVTAEGALLPDGLHLNGVVEAEDWTVWACERCHGTPDTAAPPPALDGATATSDLGVGAHLAHLAPTSGKPVPCVTCHIVPETPDAPGHLDDGLPGAEVVFSGGALRADGVLPSYEAGACANTACHGVDRPVWTGDAPCGSCHGAPPQDHPRQACARCHEVSGPELSIAQPALHIDGVVDLTRLGPESCGECHDEGRRAAPGGSHAAHARFECAACHVVPEAVLDPGHLDGLTDTGRVVRCADSACHGWGAPIWGEAETVQGCDACHSARPTGHASGACGDCHPGTEDPRHVDGALDLTFEPGCEGCHGAPPDTGAHLAHLTASAIASALTCETCHVVPGDVLDPGHLDPDPVEVGLVTGRFDGGTCQETGCHDGLGASVPMPDWNDGPAAGACGACHGIPPPGHPDWSCDRCHGAVIDADGIIIAPELHINGEVDVQ